MSSPPAVPESERPCLLLVDDTPANVDVLVGLLKDDYALKIATRGAKALRICEQGDRIDLILLDVMMPEMDGFEVCRRLRANPLTREIPIIFLTAKTALEDIVLGFDVGANDYVTKPFRPPELLARVRTHLMLQAQKREIAAANNDLKELLHIICHDVANQFAVMRLVLDLVKVAPGTSITDYLPHLLAAVRNGIGLTDVVRRLRQSEDKVLTLEPVALAEAAREAVFLAEDRLRAKKLEVAISLPEVPVLAERFSLTNSVFGNLLANAIKFSHPGSRIEIDGRVEAGMAWVAFRDRGVGIPPELLGQLFDFTRSRSRPGTAGEAGTGFGLPLLHRFVAKYGGSVEVISRDIAAHPADHGTEFRLRLPLAGADREGR